ncbi:MAG: T9SS type A sorting domain-containing protein [Syntrophothermus sp.]
MKKKSIALILSLFLFSALNTHAQKPYAYDVAIQGEQYLRHILTGIYSYGDTLLRPEGQSMYQWYRADSLNQVDLVPIDTATKIAYVTDSLKDKNKYVIFQVTPVAHGTGDTIGIPVRIWTSTRMFWLGVSDLYASSVRFYPNPAVADIQFSESHRISLVMVFSPEGRIISEGPLVEGKMNVSSLSPGLYLLKVLFTDGKMGTARLLKL